MRSALQHTLVLPLATLAIVSTLAAQEPTTERLGSMVDSAARALIASKATPSVTIAISRRGRTIYAKAFGTADLEQGVAATPATVYLIGSITKQFTAAAVLSLVEEGKLSLADTLGKFFPDWPSAGRGVTVAQLLNHTSGIKDYTEVPRWLTLMALPLSHDSIVALFRSEPMDFAPGTAWRYDNSGYVLLGLIIEKASGMTYQDFVQTRLFQRAGLSSTYYCDSRAVIVRRAPGYNAKGGVFTNAAPIYVDQAFAAGAICSTAEDLVAWTRALRGGRVVSRDSYGKMTTPLPLPNGKAQVYGFGLGVGDVAGHRVISHNGGINGFNSYMASFPDDSLIVAVVANVESGAADKVGKHVGRWALGIPDEVVKDMAVTEGETARIIGKYAAGPTVIEVRVEGGRLVAIGLDEPTRVLYQGNGDFRLESNPELSLTFSGTGAKAEAMVVSANGAVVITLTRVP